MLRLGWIIASLLFLSACGSFIPPLGGDQSRCTPAFPYQQGWLGGDAAYSITVSNSQSLWFFGDTFIGEEKAESRHDAAFIANSVARSTCTGDNWQIDYFWKTGRVGVTPIFESGTPAYKYWPLSGFWHEARLYVFLARVETLDDGGAFAFRTIGVDLARIGNPNALPNKWQIETRPIYDGLDLIPGVANIIDGNTLLIYTALEGARFKVSGDHHAVILARLPFAHLETPKEHFETYLVTGDWVSGLTDAFAERVMTEGATEMSLRRHDALQRWIAVMPDAHPFALSAVLKSAPSPFGSWTNGEKLFDYAEQQAALAEGDKNVFCYAAKEHAQFARSQRELLVTYVCNTQNDAVLDRMDLYAPVAKRIPAPHMD